MPGRSRSSGAPARTGEPRADAARVATVRAPRTPAPSGMKSRSTLDMARRPGRGSAITRDGSTRGRIVARAKCRSDHEGAEPMNELSSRLGRVLQRQGRMAAGMFTLAAFVAVIGVAMPAGAGSTRQALRDTHGTRAFWHQTTLKTAIAKSAARPALRFR